jgi:hypothetical protein
MGGMEAVEEPSGSKVKMNRYGDGKPVEEGGLEEELEDREVFDDGDGRWLVAKRHKVAVELPEQQKKKEEDWPVLDLE